MRAKPNLQDPLENSRCIIVGIDPGTTTAFAALNLSMKVVGIGSRKEFSLNELIGEVAKLGIPLIVATDKKDVPKFIKDFSQKTGAKIYAPSYDTKKQEKKSLVEKYGFLNLVKNVHEVDALASALYAYNFFSPIFSKVMKKLNKSRTDTIPPLDRIFENVIIRGMSINQAFERKEEIKKPPQRKKIIKKKVESMQFRELFLTKIANKYLKEKIKSLEKEIKNLKSRTFNPDKKAKRLINLKERRIYELERENDLLRKINKALVNKLDSVEKFLSRIDANSLVVKKIKSLTRDELKNINPDITCVFVENLSSISKSALRETKISLVITPRPSPLDGLYVVNANELNLLEWENYVIVDKTEVEERLDKIKKRERLGKLVRDILLEYRRERIQEFIDKKRGD